LNIYGEVSKESLGINEKLMTYLTDVYGYRTFNKRGRPKNMYI